MRATVTDVICKDGTMTATIVKGDQTFAQALSATYLNMGIPVDKLPHTLAFERFCNLVNRNSDCLVSQFYIWGELIKARKSGKLPRLNGGRKS